MVLSSTIYVSTPPSPDNGIYEGIRDHIALLLKTPLVEKAALADQWKAREAVRLANTVTVPPTSTGLARTKSVEVVQWTCRQHGVAGAGRHDAFLSYRWVRTQS